MGSPLDERGSPLDERVRLAVTLRNEPQPERPLLVPAQVVMCARDLSKVMVHLTDDLASAPTATTPATTPATNPPLLPRGTEIMLDYAADLHTWSGALHDKFEFVLL